MRLAWVALALAGASGLPTGCLGPKLTSDRPYERREALLGLSGDSVAVAARRSLSDPDWRVAATACNVALREKLRSVAMVAAEHLKTKRFEDERLEHFVRLVAQLGRERDRFLLAALLRHARPAVRYQALRGLDPAALGRPGMEPQISVAVSDKDPRIRYEAKRILRKFESTRSQIILAYHAKKWGELGHFHAVSYIVRGLKRAAPDARPFILVSARSAGAPLFLAILRDKALAGLHGQAYSELSLVGGSESDPAVKRYQAETGKRLAPLIDDTLKACEGGSTDALDKLASWARNPQYSFLKPLGDAVKRCRAALGANPKKNQPSPPKKPPPEKKPQSWVWPTDERGDPGRSFKKSDDISSLPDEFWSGLT